MTKRKGYLLSIEGCRIGFKGTDAKVLTPEIAAELLIPMVRRIGHTVTICQAEDKEAVSDKIIWFIGHIHERAEHGLDPRKSLVLEDLIGSYDGIQGSFLFDGGLYAKTNIEAPQHNAFIALLYAVAAMLWKAHESPEAFPSEEMLISAFQKGQSKAEKTCWVATKLCKSDT